MGNAKYAAGTVCPPRQTATARQDDAPKEFTMPLVRIDLAHGKPAEYRRAIGDVVYDAMRQTINVPEGDRFQIIAEHAPENLILDP
jgi:hypothetical protein